MGGHDASPLGAEGECASPAHGGMRPSPGQREGAIFEDREMVRNYWGRRVPFSGPKDGASFLGWKDGAPLSSMTDDVRLSQMSNSAPLARTRISGPSSDKIMLFF